MTKQATKILVFSPGMPGGSTICSVGFGGIPPESEELDNYRATLN